MAAALNSTRMRDSRIIVLMSVFLLLASGQMYTPDQTAHKIIAYAGYFLTALCALGRVYTTAFIGGRKNAELVTTGPFSVVRNPLYLFSLAGVTGIALVTMHLAVIVFAPLTFFFLYRAVIGREEKFLARKFGDGYAAYTARVPRLMPDFSLYRAPDTVAMSPRYLNKALFDAIWWFVPFMALELLRHFDRW